MIKDILARVAETGDEFGKKLLFLGALNMETTENGAEFIVVGGSAVELYSFGKYRSGDIDIVSSASYAIGDILEKNGFRREGKYFISDELGLFIEIPDSVLAGDNAKVRTLDLGNGMSVKVIGLEDLIIDRLNSCVHWKFQTDCEWSAYLVEKFKNDLDMDYLRETAKKEGVLGKLDEIIEMTGQSGRKKDETDEWADNQTHSR